MSSVSESPNQRNQNKPKYLVCISNTAGPTLLLTDAPWNKEGTVLTAQRLTANHIRVVPASWPITCLSCSGLPPPPSSCLKFPWLWTNSRGEERRAEGEEFDRVRRMAVVFTVWSNQNKTVVGIFPLRKSNKHAEKQDGIV